jgi:multimeric flavodoxin WrbA
MFLTQKGVNMKILAICGSPRKGNTYAALNSIRDNYPDIDFELLQLNDMNFQPCKGCYACIKLGEDKCPSEDDRDQIIKEMLDADGIILATPVYSHMISAIMKNFFERLGFYAHRPVFFDKYAMSLATCSGYGADEALKYMDKMLSVFGFTLVPPLELQIRPGKMPENKKIQNNEKTIEACNRLFSRIEKGDRAEPTISLMVPFAIFKYVSEIDKNTMKADYEYYKDKSEYYYDTKIPFLKKFIAGRVVKKIIDGFN